MKYRDFINEIRELLSVEGNLYNLPNTDQDTDFREWRNKLTSYIALIEQEGYIVICGVRIRSFGAGYKKDTTRLDMYNTELRDTLNQLRVLVESYDKYGAPKKMRLEGKDIKDIPTISQIIFSLKAHHGFYTLIIFLFVITSLLYIGSLLELKYHINEELGTFLDWLWIFNKTE